MTTTILALDLGTTTGWALRTATAHHQRHESFKPQRFEGGGMRFLRFKRWLTELKRPCRHRRAVLRGSAPARLDRCRARLRRLHGHAHRVVRAPPDPVPGRAGRHDQEARDRQGQCRQGRVIARDACTWPRPTTTTKPMPWRCCTGPSRRRRCDDEDPIPPIAAPSGAAARRPPTWRHQATRLARPAHPRRPEPTTGWTSFEREFVRRIGERLYGGKRRG
jgi:hypothetical protein